jgi:hypothetical protein
MEKFTKLLIEQTTLLDKKHPIFWTEGFRLKATIPSHSTPAAELPLSPPLLFADQGTSVRRLLRLTIQR